MSIIFVLASQYRSHSVPLDNALHRPRWFLKKHGRQELAKISDCSRRKAVAEFRLCVGNDCLGTHLHRIGIRPDPYCILCSLHKNYQRFKTQNSSFRCQFLYSYFKLHYLFAIFPAITNCYFLRNINIFH